MMMKNYLRERASWIILFMILQLLVILVSYLDPSIPITSMLYIVFLSAMIFIIFFIIRYYKETKFFKNIEEWDSASDLPTIVHAESPFEKLIIQQIYRQTDRLQQESSKSLLYLEQERDQLLGWIHEVKTPLTAMNLIIDRLDDKKIKTDLKHEWLRLYLLLDQQLHQKRIPFIENDLYMENADLKLIIFTEIKMLQSWCIQKGIGFDVTLEVKDVLTDAKWCAFIIRQLLTNAVKYSDKSEIIIHSYLKDGQVILKVQDFGRGISRQDLPRIFDKGFTSTVLHQDHAATGMGLYLAQRAAQPLDIHIGVTSTWGEGTTFTLTFPQRNDFARILSM